jgi:hypothetical protein
MKDLQGPRFQIFVYYPRRRLLPGRTRAFVDHLIATVAASPALAGAGQDARAVRHGAVPTGSRARDQPPKASATR